MVERRPARALVLAIVVAVLIGACGTPDPGLSSATSTTGARTTPAADEASPTPTMPEPSPTVVTPSTVEEVYQRVAQSIQRDDFLYYAVIEVDQNLGPFARTGTVEQWVDGDRDVARVAGDQLEAIVGIEGEQPVENVEVIRDDGRYALMRSGKVHTSDSINCYGAGIAASVVLNCPGPNGDWTTTVEQADYEGQPAVVLVTVLELTGSDRELNFTQQLYLDPDTFLPIAEVMEGSIDNPLETFSLRGTRQFTHEFIPVDSVPPDFFDPASIGPVEQGPDDSDPATPSAGSATGSAPPRG